MYNYYVTAEETFEIEKLLVFGVLATSLVPDKVEGLPNSRMGKGTPDPSWWLYWLHTKIQVKKQDVILYHDKDGRPGCSTCNKTFKWRQGLKDHRIRASGPVTTIRSKKNSPTQSLLTLKRKKGKQDRIYLSGGMKMTSLKSLTTNDISKTWVRSWKQSVVRVKMQEPESRWHVHTSTNYITCGKTLTCTSLDLRLRLYKSSACSI